MTHNLIKHIEESISAALLAFSVSGEADEIEELRALLVEKASKCEEALAVLHAPDWEKPLSPLNIHSGKNIELRIGDDDWRDFLDGKAIHNGDQLQMWSATKGWVYCRYEVSDYREKDATLYFENSERWLERDSMFFRWPES